MYLIKKQSNQLWLKWKQFRTWKWVSKCEHRLKAIRSLCVSDRKKVVEFAPEQEQGQWNLIRFFGYILENWIDGSKIIFFEIMFKSQPIQR